MWWNKATNTPNMPFVQPKRFTNSICGHDVAIASPILKVVRKDKLNK
jgi:hypothetical protein